MKNSKYLYDQIRIEIMKKIQAGELREGDKIPTEKELGEIFDASRITIRRALKELQKEGILEVLHGKGTFVKRKKQQLQMLNLEGFTEGIEIGDNNVTKIVLENSIIDADDQLMALFKMEEPFKVMKLVREIRQDDSAFSVDYAYFPLNLFPDIEKKVADNVSTFKIIHADYDIHFESAKKILEVVYPEPEVSESLRLLKTDPVIRIKKLTFDREHRPVHYSQYYLRTDSVRIFIDVDLNDNNDKIFDLPDL